MTVGAREPLDVEEPIAVRTAPAAAPSEAFSDAERRFDAARRSIGLFAGPLAFVVIFLYPFSTLTVEAHRLAAIVALVVVWWITEAIPIPITALIGVGLATLLGVAPVAEVFAQFGSPILFLFVGSFILAKAVAEHGLDRRLSQVVLAGGRSLGRTRITIAVLMLAMSAWISNAAATAIMLPVVIGVLHLQNGGTVLRPGPATTAPLLILAYGASIGGMITPVGAAPNLITIGLLEKTSNVQIGFLMWVAVATPIALVMAAALVASAHYVFPTRAIAAPLVRQRDSVTPLRWSAGERNCAIAFLTAVVLWVAPGVFSLLLPDASLTRVLATRLDEGAVAVLAASLLFVLPVDWSKRRFTLGWAEASQIDWATILLMGGGFCLGHLMFTTGLAAAMANGLVATSGAGSLWTITAVAIGTGIILTEVTSNTAATSMLVPVMIAICQATGVNPIPPAIGTCLGASMAFMLPISTPANAIVYSTGLIPIRRMITFGFLFDVTGFFVIWSGLRILCPLLGLA
jgi:sodium-dependent dicarboxylate transporter 2/3/5